MAAGSNALHAQSTAKLQGLVTDAHGALVPGTRITAANRETGMERSAVTDQTGNYQITALPVGTYRVDVQASGFHSMVVQTLSLEVASIFVQDFRLEAGEIAQVVNVTAESQLIELATMAVGQVIGSQTMQEIPLNGRHFFELGLLVPGSVTPPQNGFLSAPLRGQGFFGLNTAGNREDAVNVQINGINLNDQTNNILNFQPPISSMREFKVDNSTFSAEYGRNSGAILNVATRSGTNDWHGELFEFFRNDALDARNFFNFVSAKPPPFKRNQFGGGIGGPAVKNKVFFFFAYEGLRQRQGIDLNSLVLSDAQRASATDPVVRRLIEMIPRSNFVDAFGASRFIGSASSAVDLNQLTLDISYNLTANDNLHGYYAFQHDSRNEPNLQGNTIPGFGDTRNGRRQVLTLNETHVFSPKLVNEARFGFNRIFVKIIPAVQLNPAELGIKNGVDRPIGLPELRIAGGGLNFGGPSSLPNVRGDTTVVASDCLSYQQGQHSLKFGGEFRRFYNNGFQIDIGTFVFPTVASFIAGNANSFSITLGDRSTSIIQNAVGLFVQDSFKFQSNLTFELGLRYELNATPTERYDRFIVFDPETVSLLRVGTDIDQPYRTNDQNFEPRVGFAWDPFRDGKTSVRAAYAVQVEQPSTNGVANTATNPPFASPLSFGGTIRLDNAFNLAGATGLSPVSVDHNLHNAYVQSWNLNLQRQFTSDTAITFSYVGSKATHLRLARNLNQPVNGIRPFASLSPLSPVLPGRPLANITQVEGTGNSSYNALWVTLDRRLSRGLQLNASYTWSKSIDNNSYNSPPTAVTVQNSNDRRGDRGLSDFDARHRFVLRAIYELPFRGNRLVDGWSLAAITQMQSGNPLNIVTSNSTVSGVANTVRPNVNGPVEIIGSPDRWFDTSAFTAVGRFGSLGRNVVIGPGFNNTDFSVTKMTKISESVSVQLRAEVFNLFNHVNFGQPGRVVGGATFGQITNTRFPTGDSGSSRQIQFAFKLVF